jgi:phosphatidylinositol dimannoside acyltransferase
MREAVSHLRAGGVVVTGAERPLPGAKYRPIFFGRPASLPVHYISLALRAGVPVIVVAVVFESDRYRLHVSEPIAVVEHENRPTTLLRNAERVLAVVGEYICLAPEQWMMFYPVWPEALAEIG